MASHTTDWFPGRVSKSYRANYDRMKWNHPDKDWLESVNVRMEEKMAISMLGKKLTVEE